MFCSSYPAASWVPVSEAGQTETVPGQVFTAGGWRVRLGLVKRENIRFNKIIRQHHNIFSFLFCRDFVAWHVRVVLGQVWGTIRPIWSVWRWSVMFLL